MRSSSLSFLGIVRKANRIAIGEEFTGATVRAGKARIIILASDASDNARKRAENFAGAGKIPLVEIPYTKNEIGSVLDRASPAMAAVTDIGLASAFIERLKLEAPGYDELAEELSEKAKKAKRRRKEALAGKRNAKTGKGRKQA